MSYITFRNRLDPDNPSPVIRSMGLGSIFAVGLIPTVNAQSTFDFYVSTAGNDSWNGLFPDFQGGSNGPKRNLTTAGGGLSLLSAGKSLGIRGGTYNETITSCPSGTSWANKVRIANYNGERVLAATLEAHLPRPGE